MLAFQAKSKRTLALTNRHIEPYNKKPKMSKFNFLSHEVPRPQNLSSIKAKDLIWMISISRTTTPMWQGWNSLITEDSLPMQSIAYMNAINLPPTRLDVVAETLRTSQKVAEECGDRMIIVHYDLAIAKPAMQIQAADAPNFDNIFICFGPFHIELAYFGTIGHFLNGSGGSQLLMEADVLASGSVNGFLNGKHYNRLVLNLAVGLLVLN